MAEPWVPILIGGALLLVGFVASLAFERYRLPEFFVLILLGMLLGHLPFEPFGPSMVVVLAPILPAFTRLTLAFILFEGGLSLVAREVGRAAGGILVHVASAMALTLLVTWFLATRVFGLGDLTGWVLGAAFIGPSAVIVLSFAPRLRIGATGRSALVVEGVVTTATAVALVLFLVRPSAEPVDAYLSRLALSIVLAVFAAFGWRFLLERIHGERFLSLATLAVVLILFGVAEGGLGGNGGIAAFVFGLVLANFRADDTIRMKEVHEGLKSFDAEITFGVRTFFFVYLGLLFRLERMSIEAVAAAALLTVGFLVARAPSALVLGRWLEWRPQATGALVASIARGVTSAVLVLILLETALVSAAEVAFLEDVLPLLILIPSSACALLIMFVERSVPKATAEPSSES